MEGEECDECEDRVGIMITRKCLCCYAPLCRICQWWSDNPAFLGICYDCQPDIYENKFLDHPPILHVVQTRAHRRYVNRMVRVIQDVMKYNKQWQFIHFDTYQDGRKDPQIFFRRSTEEIVTRVRELGFEARLVARKNKFVLLVTQGNWQTWFEE
jgi:hypothetical protein